MNSEPSIKCFRKKQKLALTLDFPLSAETKWLIYLLYPHLSICREYAKSLVLHCEGSDDRHKLPASTLTGPGDQPVIASAGLTGGPRLGGLQEAAEKKFVQSSKSSVFSYWVIYMYRLNCGLDLAVPFHSCHLSFTLVWPFLGGGLREETVSLVPPPTHRED